MPDITTVAPGALDRFVLDLVEAGFRTKDGRLWRGPIDPSLADLTTATEMALLIPNGWPYRHASVFVDGLKPSVHLNESALCLWRVGDDSLAWLRLDDLRGRIAQWAERYRGRATIDDPILDPDLYWRPYDASVLATIDLSKIRWGNGGSGDARAALKDHRLEIGDEGMQSGYLVSHRVVNGAIWVPQNRQRILIVALRADLFAEGGKFEFEDPGDPKAGPKLDGKILEPDSDALERYRLTEGVWKALLAHRERHEGKGSGFGYGIALRGDVTRTLSARYYKDGAEILLRMPDGGRPRRLTPREAGRLMGFTRENLGFDFEIPVSDVQAYKQFGNSVVVPQFQWVADGICDRAGDLFAKRLEQAEREQGRADRRVAGRETSTRSPVRRRRPPCA